MNRYPSIMRSVQEEPWAILPSKLAVIANLLTDKAVGIDYTPEEIASRLQGAAASRPAGRVQGMVAVVPLFGTIFPRANLMTDLSGGTSAQKFLEQFRIAMASPDVGAVVIEMDSPGGQVSGVQEVASEILASRGRKPIIAVANSLMASAAYWIASAADQIVATPSAEVGSIGVFAVHQDLSEAMAREGIKTTLISAGRYKVEQNPFEPLSDEAREAAQAHVNETYASFIEAVARGRGVRASDVRDGFGEGRVLSAKRALQAGMVDRIETLDQTLTRLVGTGSVPVPSQTAEDTTSQMFADDLSSVVTEEATEQRGLGRDARSRRLRISEIR